MKTIHRDTSWLSYNRRVIQESEDKSNSAGERLKFISIAINNLKSFLKERYFFHLNSKNELTDELFKKIKKQFSKCDKIFGEILEELKEHNIYFPKISELDDKQWKYLSEWYRVKLKPKIHPVFLNRENDFIALENGKIYLLAQLIYHHEEGNALIEIPFTGTERFIEIPSAASRVFTTVDEIMKQFLADVFRGHAIPKTGLFEVISGTEFIHQDEAKEYFDQWNEDLKSLSERFLLVENGMTGSTLKIVLKKTESHRSSCVKNMKHLLLSDCSELIKFLPEEIKPKSFVPAKHPLEKKPGVLDSVSGRDEMLCFPYQSFNAVIQLLKEAANSDDVSNIFISLYRTAHPSAVAEQLVVAAQNKKNVIAFLELKASENEEENILLAQRLEKSGVKVLRIFPEKKIHAKAILIERKSGGIVERTCLLSTGNFNEKTAALYTDVALISSDEKITEDVASFFAALEQQSLTGFQTSQVKFSPLNFRTEITEQIQNCILAAAKNTPAKIILKLNNLEDKKIISHLYKAAAAGVTVEIIVRSICTMKPAPNIRIISIVDHLLEHSRIFSFKSSDSENIFISSADLMSRNLDKRIEFLLPVNNESHKKMLNEILQLHLRDNTRARIIDKKQKNKYVSAADGEAPIRAQEKIAEYFSSIKES